MLNGAISYLGHKFDVFGYDTASDLKLRLKSNNFDSILLMADSSMQEQGDELWERGVSIAPAKITVETANEVDKTTGRRIKKPINVEMFCRLGATLRYIKSHCYVRYMEGYTGMKLASGEFEPEERIKYIIPFENKEDGEILATVELRLGNITSIHAKTDIFEIDLEDDPMLDTMVYPVFKDGVQKGFAFNKEYLGFNVNSQVLEKSTILGGMYRNLAEVMAAHPDKEFEWLRTKNYKIVTDDMLEELCDYIYNFDGYVYYDTETTGLNINFKSRVGQADQCVGIILSVVDGESFFFPMQMKAIKNLCDGDHFYFMEHYMRRILEKKELVAHNMSFDWKVSYIYDINANIVHDTMALFKLTLGNEDEDLPVSLKHLARLFLKRDSLELDDLVIGDSWGEDDIKFWDLPEELVKYYACADTDNTRGLLKYAEQNNLLAKYNATKVYDIEIAFSYAVAYQEFYGHLFDVNKVEELRKEIQNKMEGYYKQMVDLVGHDFNPNSSKQLLTIMYEELGIPVQISRKTNRPTTDKDTLKHLGELTNLEGKAMYPFCALLLKYREYEGVRKIIDKFPELATSDGYLFPGVQQYGTRTGRVSIKAPNYQSYNKPVKKNIIPRPGYYMFDTDYSSVEYRVLGNMSGNKMIKENFYDPDFDYHTYQASRMYRVPYAAVTGTLRKAAKGINFGLPYGMGDESLGIRIFGEKSEENTRKAASLRRSYFKGQEDIQNFFENARDSGVQNGFTSTYFGRRRYYDSKKFTIPAIRRQAGNQVIQGTAADIYKLAVGRVFKRVCREGWLGKVMLTGFIHDELLGEVSTEIDPMKWLKVLREEFEVKVYDQNGNPWCPLFMGFGWGRSWEEAKSTEIPIKLQWEFVEKYGETGYPSWDKDIDKFCDKIPDLLRDFEIRDCGNQLLAEESQGKEIKPALNSAILGVLKADTKYYPEVLKDESLRDVYHISGSITDSEGNIIPNVPETKDTQEAITYFCMLHSLDRSKINVLNISDVTISNEGMASESDVIHDSEYDYEDEAALALKRKNEMLLNRISVLGMFVDIDNHEVVGLLLPMDMMNVIKGRLKLKETKPNGFDFKLVDLSKNMKYNTPYVVDSVDISGLQSIYTTYLNLHAKKQA